MSAVRRQAAVAITPAMTYAEAALAKINSNDNYKGAPLTLRELGDHLHFSSEHMRRVMLRNSPLISEAFNAALCKALRLDPETMWEKNLRERGIHKAQRLNENFSNDSSGESTEVKLLTMFSRLGAAERRRLMDIATGLYEQSKLGPAISSK